MLQQFLRVFKEFFADPAKKLFLGEKKIKNFEDLEIQLITKSSQQQDSVKEKIGGDKIKKLILNKLKIKQ